MARRPFFDTHVHFWDLTHSTLTWNWLARDAVHPILGDIDGIKIQRYMAEEFISETRFQNVTKCIHVQAAIGSADPVEETQWLQEQADRTGFPNGIVAQCDLAADDAESILERHLVHANTRGIRDFGQGDYLVNPRWREGYGLLAKHGLVFCMDVIWENMGKARALSVDYPDVVLCIDHTGFPRERGAEYFENWRAGMTSLADAPNVVCKISGLGMCDNDWTVESWRPWILASLEAFGVERTFFGTNWPVDRLYSSYGDVLDAYEEIISELSDAEKDALFYANAERIFRL